MKTWKQGKYLACKSSIKSFRGIWVISHECFEISKVAESCLHQKTITLKEWSWYSPNFHFEVINWAVDNGDQHWNVENQECSTPDNFDMMKISGVTSVKVKWHCWHQHQYWQPEIKCGDGGTTMLGCGLMGGDSWAHTLHCTATLIMLLQLPRRSRQSSPPLQIQPGSTWLLIITQLLNTKCWQRLDLDESWSCK